jgi:hypothetical protein
LASDPPTKPDEEIMPDAERSTGYYVFVLIVMRHGRQAATGGMAHDPAPATAGAAALA